MIAVVIPVKPLEGALSRLSGVLRPVERRAVQVAMLRDVIRAGAGFTDRVIVVSSDDRVETIAREFGAQVVADAAPATGIDDAVARGVAACEADEVLVVMGDLPLATSDDLHATSVALGAGRGVVCAVSCDGTGTNALFLRPPTVMATHFGVDSLERHMREATSVGVPAIALSVQGLMRDVDTPADLSALIHSGYECATVRVCHELGVADTLIAVAAPQ